MAAKAVTVQIAGLADALAGAVTADLKITPPPEIGFVHRRSEDAEIYVVINTGQ